MDAGHQYTIYGRIASGGMASVHFGRVRGSEGFGRTVAIKRLHPHLAEDPAFRAMLVDEARMAGRIHHPHVVPTLDVVSGDGEIFVVMAYVHGESLARLMRFAERRDDCRRALPLDVAVAIAAGALHGLHAAHLATSEQGAPLGIVHRDVSPQNLLVGIDGLARVIDFGIAKAAGRLQVTREGTLKGKRPYMAPEQIAGRAVSLRTDVYAFGVVLWEMLASRRLFEGEEDGEIEARVLRGVDVAPSRYAPDLPAALDALVMRALAVSPADRFASALEMAEALVSAVTPAMPSDVGRWVQESAREALAARSARLAEIERGADVSTGPLETGADAGARREISTVHLESRSSGSRLATPASSASRHSQRGRTLAAVLATGGLFASGLLAWGMGSRPPTSAMAAITPPGAPPAASLAEPSVPEPATPKPIERPASTAPAAARTPRAAPRLTTPAPPLRTPSPRSSPSCSIETEYNRDGQPHFRNVCR